MILFLIHKLVSDNASYITLTRTCEKEIVLSWSQLCCNSNCNTSVNNDLILLFLLHLFCLNSTLFSVFNFQFLDICATY